MKKVLNSFHLKCITVGLMSAGVAMQMILYWMTAGKGIEATEQQNMLYFIGCALYLAAFPLAAFLLVEGFLHTSDKKKLFLRLLIAALAAEIPMDLANPNWTGIGSWWQSQNFFFTLLIGFCVLWSMEVISSKYPVGTLKYNLMTLMVYLAAALVAVLFQAEQGSIGVLMIIALYLFQGNRMFSMLCVAALYSLFMGSSGGLEYVPALSVIFVWMYNGEEGKKSKLTRIVFYAMYPVVYCVTEIFVKYFM